MSPAASSCALVAKGQVQSTGRLTRSWLITTSHCRQQLQRGNAVPCKYFYTGLQRALQASRLGGFPNSIVAHAGHSVQSANTGCVARNAASRLNFQKPGVPVRKGIRRTDSLENQESRREVVLGGCWLALSTLLILMRPARSQAQEEAAPAPVLPFFGNAVGDDASASSRDPNASMPTLSVKEYVVRLNKARPVAWQQIANNIKEDNFLALANSLVISPFDDVRQACFFIPWALMNKNEINPATDCRKAYSDLVDHIEDLDRISRAAAEGQAQAEQVQQAFYLLSATLDRYLAVVPVKYLKEANEKPKPPEKPSA